jgi:hypothetical protein
MTIGSEIRNINNKEHEKYSEESSNAIHNSTSETIIAQRSVSTIVVPKNAALARQQRK